MFLDKFDFISPPITLYYFNKERHINPISGCLTLTVYVSILICSLFFFIQFLSKDNPVTFYYNHFQEDVGIYYFNTSGFFHYVTIGSQPIDFTSVNVIGIPRFIPVYTKNNDLSSIDKYYIYGNCNDNDMKGLQVNEYNKTEFSNSACIRKMYDRKLNKYFNTEDNEFVYPDLRHGASNPNYNLYAVVVELCRNESIFNEHKCKSIENREEYINSISSVSISVIDHLVTVEQYKQPIESFYYKISSGVNHISKSFNSNQLNFNPLIVKTDKGILFSSYKEMKSYIFDQNVKTSMDAGNTGILAGYNFWIQNNVEIYTRSYKKIQDTCASIGGMSKIFLIVCDVMNYVVRELAFVLDTMKLYSIFAFKISNSSNSSSSHNNLSYNNKGNVHSTSYVQNSSHCSNCSNDMLKVNNQSNDEIKHKQSAITTRVCSNGIDNKQLRGNEGKDVKRKKSLKRKYLEINGIKMRFDCKNIVDFIKLVLIKSFKRSSQGKKIIWFQKQRRMILSEEHLFESYFQNKSLINHIQNSNCNCIMNNNNNKKCNNKQKKIMFNSNIKGKWLSDVPLSKHNKSLLNNKVGDTQNNKN